MVGTTPVIMGRKLETTYHLTGTTAVDILLPWCTRSLRPRLFLNLNYMIGLLASPLQSFVAGQPVARLCLIVFVLSCAVLCLALLQSDTWK